MQAFSEVPDYEYLMAGNCAVCFIDKPGIFYITGAAGKRGYCVPAARRSRNDHHRALRRARRIKGQGREHQRTGTAEPWQLRLVVDPAAQLGPPPFGFAGRPTFEAGDLTEPNHAISASQPGEPVASGEVGLQGSRVVDDDRAGMPFRTGWKVSHDRQDIPRPVVTPRGQMAPVAHCP